MARNPQKAAAYLKKGQEAIRSENFGLARTMLSKGLDFDKDNLDLMRRLGHVLIATGNADQARELLERAVKKHPNHPDTILMLAHAYKELARIEDMHRTLDKALSRDPTHGPALHAKVMGYISSGEVELARAALDAAGEIEHPHTLVYMARAKLARTRKDYPPAIDDFNRVLEHPDALDRHKRSARFELGHCYDAIGDYDKAFEQFRLANAGHARGKLLHADSMIEMWSRAMLDSLPMAENRSRCPVFIVGMPRSGTTLTEQILLAHPSVGGVGECPLMANMLLRKTPTALTCDDVNAYADEYLAYLDERAGPGPERVIDKHMGAERTLGLISRVLPGARVIHCLRDPIDSCLSSYFQNFGTNVSYSRDLIQLGKQYIAHRRLMDHWHGVLDLEIMTSSYERLVAEFEPGARRLVEHIGLDFHEDCLRFHESREHVGTASSVQVRSPIYQTSAQRWRNYEKHVGPLIEALGEYAVTEPTPMDSPTPQGAE